jgi:hypothetical protein
MPDEDGGFGIGDRTNPIALGVVGFLSLPLFADQ